MDYTINSNGTIYSNKSGRYLNPQKKGKGYLGVSLRIDGKTVQKYVHRLVAEKYLPNPNNLPEVNHKDGDITNNDVSNLEWCSRQDNVNHAVATGLHHKGVTSGNSKLTEKQVKEMRRLREEAGISYAKLAALFGVTAMSAHGVCNGKYYRDVV